MSKKKIFGIVFIVLIMAWAATSLMSTLSGPAAEVRMAIEDSDNTNKGALHRQVDTCEIAADQASMISSEAGDRALKNCLKKIMDQLN